VKYPLIARYIADTLWSIHPSKLAELLEVFAYRAAGHEFTAEEIRARIGDDGGSTASASKRGVVAVVPVRGVIAHRMGTMGDSSGGTSCEQIGRMIDQVAADASIGTIVYDFDTPGGTVPGVQELAAKMFGLREQKKQIAMVNGLAASAGYWLASQCDEIVCVPSGTAGSIGVYTAHRTSRRRWSRKASRSR
jgi:ClpP class serine protease